MSALRSGFARALEELGAETLELSPVSVSGGADAVFTRDSAVLVERRGKRMALLARPRFGQERSAQAACATALYRAGFEVHAPVCAPLEGGDVILPRGGEAAAAFLGHGPRSSARAASVLASFLDVPVFPLRLRGAHLFHLDTALAVLDDGTAIVCAEALDPESLRVLERAPGIARVFTVPLAEARVTGVGVVEVGDAVVLGGSAPTLEAIVRARGKRPVVYPLGELRHGGGGPACLANRVYACEVRAAEETRAA